MDDRFLPSDTASAFTELYDGHDGMELVEQERGKKGLVSRHLGIGKGQSLAIDFYMYSTSG